MVALLYADGSEAEEFDQVEFERGGGVFEGTVTKLFPRSQRVMVRYADHQDTRKDGDPKTKLASVPVAEVELMRRDG